MKTLISRCCPNFGKWLFSILLLACVSARAQSGIYFVTHLLSSNSPYYNTNWNTAAGGTTHPAYVVNSLWLDGGAMVSNSLSAQLTNAAMWTQPVHLTWFDQFGLVVTCNALTNTNTILSLTLYPVPDGTNIVTNASIALGLITNSSGVNFIWFTNIAPLQGPAVCKDYQLAIGNAGTNTVTNLDAQVIVKQKVDHTTQQ